MSLIVGIRAAEGLVLATDSLLRREDANHLLLVIANIDPGMLHGELYWLAVPNEALPSLTRHREGPFFHGFWATLLPSST